MGVSRLHYYLQAAVLIVNDTSSAVFSCDIQHISLGFGLFLVGFAISSGIYQGFIHDMPLVLLFGRWFWTQLRAYFAYRS